MKGQERDVSLLTRERKRKGAKKVRGGRRRELKMCIVVYGYRVL